jgi:hypothetical protein
VAVDEQRLADPGHAAGRVLEAEHGRALQVAGRDLELPARDAPGRQPVELGVDQPEHLAARVGAVAA